MCFDTHELQFNAFYHMQLIAIEQIKNKIGLQNLQEEFVTCHTKVCTHVLQL